MGTVYTLNGPVDAADLGPVLPHEHLPMNYFAWDTDEFEPGSKAIVRTWYAEILDDLLQTPFRTLVDVSPIGHGRDIQFRKDLVGERDLNVIMATGCYIDAHQPEWVKEKSAEELAEIFVTELEHGIGDTGVRAGIIKLAPDASSGQSRKVCRAAALASQRTNARITTHSCNRNRETFDLLTGFGAAPENIYVGHADFCEFEENEYVCSNGGHLLFTVLVDPLRRRESYPQLSGHDRHPETQGGLRTQRRTGPHHHGRQPSTDARLSPINAHGIYPETHALELHAVNVAEQ
jgi:phosphotriesterase-related protein